VAPTHRALLMAPMTSELKPLVRYARAVRFERDGVRAFHARLGPVQVVMTQAGVGPAVARAATARALEAFPSDHVVVCGIAGGLDPALPVGSVMIPEVVLDLASGQRYTAAALGATTRAGTIGVADHLITDPGRLEELRDDGVAALEMESSGVAAACEAVGVPWSTVRVIGDRPDEGLTDDAVMSFLRPDGTADAPAAIRFLLSHPARIPGLMRLGRDSSKAAAAAARTALRALGWDGAAG